MKFILFTNVVSPHQLPLAREIIARIGAENYRYVHTEELESQRQAMGWNGDCQSDWCIAGDERFQGLLDCDLLFSELRIADVFERRIAEKRLTCYVSERWFKPPKGALRLLSPSYWRLAGRIVRLLESPWFHYFPQGIHAARDMMRIQGLMHGDMRCLFRAPKVAFEAKPGGRIIPLEQAVSQGLLSGEDIAWGRKHGFVRIPEARWRDVMAYEPWRNYRLWGYFVEAGEVSGEAEDVTAGKKVLWVGRMLDWKRVETLVDAVPDDMELHLYGHGPDEENIRRHASRKGNVFFHDFVSIEQVRKLMRQHDIYVLPSDGGEGWGAVLNEALEEGMIAIASLESGAGATMLESNRLFPAGNAEELRRKLTEARSRGGIGLWTARNAAAVLCDFMKKHTV